MKSPFHLNTFSMLQKASLLLEKRIKQKKQTSAQNVRVTKPNQFNKMIMIQDSALKQN